VGAYFFVKGLDEYDDYLRFNHGIWHMMAAISNYYGLKSTTYERITYY
jgi:predicted membrane channel-forming protein YqfA (hemolysin III family)